MTRYGILLGKKPPVERKVIQNYFMGIDFGGSSHAEVLVGHIVKNFQEYSREIEHVFTIDYQEQIFGSSIEIMQRIRMILAHFTANNSGILKIRTDSRDGGFCRDLIPPTICDQVSMTREWKLHLYQVCLSLKLAPEVGIEKFQDAYELALSLAVDNVINDLEPRYEFRPLKPKKSLCGPYIF